MVGGWETYNRSQMGRTLLVLTLVGLVGAALSMGGCRKPLFPEEAQRSPYERYLALRGRSAPETEPNAFGREQPALRQRLRPLEQP